MALPADRRSTALVSLWSLAGQWSLVRKIRHADGRENSLIGNAAFTRSGPRLIQEESGLLQLDDQALEARQRLVWTQDGPLLRVHFADMRPFHEIPTGVADPEAVHDCPPDRYRVAYDFARWPIWRSAWTVIGPHKDYIMNSTYTPV